MIIVVAGSEIGFQKIEFTHLVRKRFGYGLSEGKAYTDAIVDGVVVSFEVASQEADMLIAEMRALGAQACVAQAHTSAA